MQTFYIIFMCLWSKTAISSFFRIIRADVDTERTHTFTLMSNKNKFDISLHCMEILINWQIKFHEVGRIIVLHSHLATKNGITTLKIVIKLSSFVSGTAFHNIFLYINCSICGFLVRNSCDSWIVFSEKHWKWRIPSAHCYIIVANVWQCLAI